MFEDPVSSERRKRRQRAQAGPFIVVAGRPGSGNRLVARLIDSNRRHSRVLHQIPPDAVDWDLQVEGGRWPTHVVHIERDKSWDSMRRRAKEWEGVARGKGYSSWKWEKLRQAGLDTLDGQNRHLAALLERLAHLPVLHVKYEDIVRDPRGAGLDIVEFCRGGKGLWGEDVYDGDGKYEL